jgi:hypothetical protein
MPSNRLLTVIAATMIGQPLPLVGQELEWHRIDAPGPGLSTGHTMAYDEARRNTILLKGESTPIQHWEWDGFQWLQVSIDAIPGPVPSSAPFGIGVIYYSRSRTSNIYYDRSSGRPRVVARSRSAAYMYPSEPNYGALIFHGGETWEYSNGQWHQLPINGTPVLSACSVAHDTRNAQSILAGGLSACTSSTNCNPASTAIIARLQDTSWSIPGGMTPTARHNCSMAFDEQRQKVVLFGGDRSDGAPLSDTWEFDGISWTLAATSGPPPGAHPMTFNAYRQKCQMFTRSTTSAPSLETWEWDGITWSNLGLNGPSSRTQHSCAFDSHRQSVVIYGGTGGGADLQATWELRPRIGGASAPIAIATSSTTSTPDAVSHPATAALPYGGALFFGGATNSGPNSRTYTLAGTTWSERFPPLSPVARTEHTLLLDPARQNNLLFGGKNPLGTQLADTWTWANNQWTLISTTAAPSARSGHRMAFDRSANLGLLLGGEDATGTALNDFWSWNGTTWTQLTPATLPPARAGHGMAYDALRNRTVIFGGKAGTSRHSDVWEWDGSTWTDATPQGSPAWGPSARDGHGMAYDPLSERVVLHGGETASGCQQDVWSWNGTEWTIHLPQSGPVPSARTGSQLFHDSGTNRLLLFAGGCGTNYTNDLWTLSLPTFARTNSYGTPCVGSRGPLTLSVLNNSLPIIGQTFRMEMSNVPTFSPCAGLLGFSNTELNGIPLPFDLAFLSMPGCSAYMSKDLNFQLPPPNNVLNTTAWDLAIPMDPVFLSLHIYMQGLALEFGGTRFATVTNGIDARIGDR